MKTTWIAMSPELLKACLDDFHKYGKLSIPVLMRRHKINGIMAKAIIAYIDKIQRK